MYQSMIFTCSGQFFRTSSTWPLSWMVMKSPCEISSCKTFLPNVFATQPGAAWRRGQTSGRRDRRWECRRLASAPSCSLTATCRTASRSCPAGPPGWLDRRWQRSAANTWSITMNNYQVHILVERVRVSPQVPHAIFSLGSNIQERLVQSPSNLFVKSLNTCWEKPMDAKSLPFLQSERHALEPLGVPGWNMYTQNVPYLSHSWSWNYLVIWGILSPGYNLPQTVRVYLR